MNFPEKGKFIGAVMAFLWPLLLYLYKYYNYFLITGYGVDSLNILHYSRRLNKNKLLLLTKSSAKMITMLGFSVAETKPMDNTKVWNIALHISLLTTNNIWLTTTLLQFRDCVE